MGRSIRLVGVAVFSAIVIGVFASSPSAEAMGNCQAKLVGNSYDCNFTDNNFPPFSNCYEFATGGESQYFDLYHPIDWGCACDAKGSSNSPSFNSSSNTFECSDDSAPFLVNGKIKGKKLLVQGIGSNGEQWIGTCTLRSSACF
ncbi:MAG: hypothetical protein ACREQH_12000 [Candidatus Binatus sp.]